MSKAVVVGINKYPDSPLNGCVNDATDIVTYLTEDHGFSPEDIVLLFDAAATKNAIVSALRDMIAGSNPGDHLLFHYSGHGTQIVSQDANEPDGLDEVLCPVDFDWDDPSTALTDNEIGAALAKVPAGTALTMVLDACHSGDSIKDAVKSGRARFLSPPPRIAAKLAGRRVLSRRRDMTHSNVVSVSACATTETASDTSFAGRPNGAFTYYWRDALKADKGASVDELARVASSSVAAYGMHPQVEGTGDLRSVPFLSPPSVRSSILTARRTRFLRSPGQVLFEQSWSVKVLGVNIGVHLRISSQDGAFDFQLTSNAGIPLSWSFRVNGDTDEEVNLGYGFRLVLAVSGWSLGDGKLEFDLAIRVAPPFFAPVTLGAQHLTLPVAVREVRAPTTPASPADLLALIQMSQFAPNQAGGRAFSIPVGSRPRAQGEPVNLGAAWVKEFGGGLFGMSYNENASYELPAGYVRDSVEVVLDPPGSGNVYFVRWLSDADETRASFEYHVGVSATWGGRATFNMIARPQVTINNPIVREVDPASIVEPVNPRPALLGARPNSRIANGHNASREPFEMDPPEGGGSVRV